MRRAIFPVMTLGVLLSTALLSTAIPAFAGLTYTCDPNIDAKVAGTCAILNSTIAGLYTSTFSNLNVNIYIQYGQTGLGQSTTGFDNQVTYTAYLAALTASAQASGNAVQVAAVNALKTFDTAMYGNGMVDIPSALGTALGLTTPPLFGTNADGTAFCTTPGTANCYNGIIVITNNPNTRLYYRTGGSEPPNAFDFYSTVEHETDEILGTASCIDTTGPTLADDCPGNPGVNIPSAVDLYRYLSAGNPVLISGTPGAYFSYNGGQTNGANGNVYNTLTNGDDYADFVSTCQSKPSVQDAEACAGHDGGVDITNDGGAEINILNAVGYKLNGQAATPPVITPGGVVPFYSTSTTIQPGSFVSIFGTNLASATTNSNGAFDTTLGGTSVMIDGKSGYLVYVSATQLNLQAPDDTFRGSVNVVVSTAAGSAASTVTLGNFGPSFSVLDGKHVAGIILRPNGTGAYGQGANSYDIVGPTGTSLGYATVAAKPGDVVELFGVGFGPTTPPVLAGQPFNGTAVTTNTVGLTIGGTTVTTLGAGEGSAGLYQVNVMIPTGLGTGDKALLATVGGVSTESGVLITLQ